MDAIGKLNAGNAEDMIRARALGIRQGLSALDEIHTATNKLVRHESGRLDEHLEDESVLHTYVLATIVELVEFLQTMQWKPWRVSVKEEDREHILEEFADIMAFLGVLVTVLRAKGFSIADITNAYIRKELVNVRRFVERESE